MRHLVQERNYLVHHLFLDFDMQSTARFDELETYLEEQREKAISEYEQLRVITKTYREAVGAYKDFIDSEQGLEIFELIQLQNSKLVTKLQEIHSVIAREDGWALLNHAGNELNKTVPEVMSNLKQLYGYKSLKAILLASQLFDVFDEPTMSGYRLLYRPRYEHAEI